MLLLLLKFFAVFTIFFILVFLTMCCVNFLSWLIFRAVCKENKNVSFFDYVDMINFRPVNKDRDG